MTDPVGFTRTGAAIISCTALVQTFDFHVRNINVTGATSKHGLVRRLRPVVRGLVCSFVDTEATNLSLGITEGRFGSTVRALLAKSCLVLFKLCRNGQWLKLGSRSKIYTERKLPEAVLGGRNEDEKRRLLQKYDLLEETHGGQHQPNVNVPQQAARMSTAMRETALDLLNRILKPDYVRNQYGQAGFHLCQEINQFGLGHVKAYCQSLRTIYSEFSTAMSTSLHETKKTTFEKDVESAGRAALKEAKLSGIEKVRIFSETEGDRPVTPYDTSGVAARDEDMRI